MQQKLCFVYVICILFVDTKTEQYMGTKPSGKELDLLKVDKRDKLVQGFIKSLLQEQDSCAHLKLVIFYLLNSFVIESLL